MEIPSDSDKFEEKLKQTFNGVTDRLKDRYERRGQSIFNGCYTIQGVGFELLKNLKNLKNSRDKFIKETQILASSIPDENAIALSATCKFCMAEFGSDNNEYKVKSGTEKFKTKNMSKEDKKKHKNKNKFTNVCNLCKKEGELFSYQLP